MDISVVIPLYNESILNEYIEVLNRKKFSFTESMISATLKVIIDYGITLDSKESGISLPDPKDLVFYEVALSQEDSFLVTGNIKHFPKKPFIVTPTEMLAIINEMKETNKRTLSETVIRYGKRGTGL
jgi:predicted nucleic acid-binding protein